MLEVELAKLRVSTKKDYELLPKYLKDVIDKQCPAVDSFETRREELNWLRKRQSRLSSMWMGMYSRTTSDSIWNVWHSSLVCESSVRGC